MLQRCCVLGCKSNYCSTLKNEGPIPTFSFPKEEGLRKAWIQAIPNKGPICTKISAVCSKHFDPSEIIKLEVYIDSSDNKCCVDLTYPKLVDGAVPHIFKKLPQPSLRSKRNRHNMTVLRLTFLQKPGREVGAFLSVDSIESFDEFVNGIPTKLKLGKWNMKVTNDGVYFYLLNIDYENDNGNGVFTICSVRVNSKMIVSVDADKHRVLASDLKWILPSNLKLSLWSQIVNLLARERNIASDVEVPFPQRQEEDTAVLRTIRKGRASSTHCQPKGEVDLMKEPEFIDVSEVPYAYNISLPVIHDDGSPDEQEASFMAVQMNALVKEESPIYDADANDPSTFSEETFVKCESEVSGEYSGNDDDAFCANIARIIKTLSPEAKVLAKTRIQQVLFEVQYSSELAGNDQMDPDRSLYQSGVTTQNNPLSGMAQVVHNISDVPEQYSTLSVPPRSASSECFGISRTQEDDGLRRKSCPQPRSKSLSPQPLPDECEEMEFCRKVVSHMKQLSTVGSALVKAKIKELVNSMVYTEALNHAKDIPVIPPPVVTPVLPSFHTITSGVQVDTSETSFSTRR